MNFVIVMFSVRWVSERVRLHVYYVLVYVYEHLLIFIYDHLLMSVVWKCNLVEPMFVMARRFMPKCTSRASNFQRTLNL